jgi:hypothetical protein
VFGSIHRLSGANRPHNSQYVVSDRGELVGRYDKRYLSHTEVSYMYAPGVAPLVFEVDGFRFGCVLCIEVNFPELFAEYESLDVDCVLASVMVDDLSRSVVAEAYGTLYNYWVSYSVRPSSARRLQLALSHPAGDGSGVVTATDGPVSPSQSSIATRRIPTLTWPLGSHGRGAALREQGSTIPM